MVSERDLQDVWVRWSEYFALVLVASPLTLHLTFRNVSAYSNFSLHWKEDQGLKEDLVKDCQEPERKEDENLWDLFVHATGLSPYRLCCDVAQWGADPSLEKVAFKDC